MSCVRWLLERLCQSLQHSVPSHSDPSDGLQRHVASAAYLTHVGNCVHQGPLEKAMEEIEGVM